MVDLNSTLSLLNQLPLDSALLGPISSTIQQLLNTISIIIGGIFGIYVISLIVKFIFLHKILKLHKEVKSQMERMEIKIDKLSKKK